MKQTLINKLEMMEATNTYLDSQADVWNAIPIIGTYKGELSSRISAIKAAALEQEASQVYIGTSLLEQKRLISKKMDILDDVLEAYAFDIENSELLAKASNSQSSYQRLTNEEFVTKVINVISLLDEHVADMANYGMTAAQIDDVKLSFDNYQAQRGKPRAYQISSRVATQNLEDLFKECTTYLGRLDNVMSRFKRSNVNFYNGYTAARTVVND